MIVIDVCLIDERFHTKNLTPKSSRSTLIVLSMCQYTSTYVSIRQYTSAYVSQSHLTAPWARCPCVSIRQYTSAYVSIRQHTSVEITFKEWRRSTCAHKSRHTRLPVIQPCMHSHTHTFVYYMYVRMHVLYIWFILFIMYISHYRNMYYIFYKICITYFKCVCVCVCVRVCVRVCVFVCVWCESGYGTCLFNTWPPTPSRTFSYITYRGLLVIAYRGELHLTYLVSSAHPLYRVIVTTSCRKILPVPRGGSGRDQEIDHILYIMDKKRYKTYLFPELERRVEEISGEFNLKECVRHWRKILFFDSISLLLRKNSVVD